MTDPSPQSELRAEIAAVLAVDVGDARAPHIADQLLPLFAARVAAIEAEREAQREGGRIERLNSDRWAARALKAEADLAAAQERLAASTENSRYQRANSDAWMERALRAEERVAAERKQAAAQALREVADDLPGADLSEFRTEQWTTDTEKVQGWLRYRASRMETP